MNKSNIYLMHVPCL